MTSNPFATIKDFIQNNKEAEKALRIYKEAQEKCEEVKNIYSCTKSKVKGSNSISTKGNYNVYVSGTGRGY